MVTVGQLAEQLGISLKEAVALCVLSGVQVQSADTTLMPADVARVHDILEGRVQLPDPKLTAKQKKLGERRSRTSNLPLLLTGLALFVLVGGCLVAGLLLRGNTGVLRAQPGDCFNAELFGPQIIPSSVAIVPCSGPHGYKAFATIDLDAAYSSWPGVDKIQQRAQDRCPELAGAAGQGKGVILFLAPADEFAWRDETTHKIICVGSDTKKS